MKFSRVLLVLSSCKENVPASIGRYVFPRMFLLSFLEAISAANGILPPDHASFFKMAQR